MKKYGTPQMMPSAANAPHPRQLIFHLPAGLRDIDAGNATRD
jgi:hypothetical protein